MLTISSPEALADRLRPLLLHLNRDLRREALPMGATVGQIALLAAIREEPGLGLRELATRERMSAPAMSGYVDRLEAAGLLVRGPIEGDRRRVGLHLTDAGRRLLRSTRRLRTAWLAKRMRRLSDAELRAIEAALEPLALLTRDERPA
ncbi:MAG TPA: MarR family transcriptional regulator [Gaiellales bacterium]